MRAKGYESFSWYRDPLTGELDWLALSIAAFTVSLLLVMVWLIFEGWPRLTEGEVVGKKFSPARTDTVMTYQTIGNMQIPQTQFYSYPDQWYLEVSGIYKGKERRESWEVSQQRHDETEIGDFVKKE